MNIKFAGNRFYYGVNDAGLEELDRRSLTFSGLVFSFSMRDDGFLDVFLEGEHESMGRAIDVNEVVAIILEVSEEALEDSLHFMLEELVK